MKSLFNWTTDMHIHPSSPNSSISEENAATKIQAGFRGYRVRKQLKKNLKMPTNEHHHHYNHHPSSSGNNGGRRIVYGKIGKTLTGQEEKSATKIQAGIRGFLVRKKQKLAADAATKIQAGFRGFKARKDLKKLSDRK